MAGRSDLAGGLVGRLKNAVVQRVVGVIALVLTTAVVGAVRMGIVSLGGGATQDDSALVHFDSLKARVTAEPEQSYFNWIEIDWHRAQLFLRRADTARACAVMDTLLNYPIDRDVADRQKDRLKAAAKFRKKRCLPEE